MQFFYLISHQLHPPCHDNTVASALVMEHDALLLSPSFILKQLTYSTSSTQMSSNVCVVSVQYVLQR